MEKDLSEVRNFVKIKALYYLKEMSSPDCEWGNWCAAPDIARGINSSPGSLRILLKRWAKWGYIEAHNFTAAQLTDKRPHTLYKIADRGRQYLSHASQWYVGWQRVKNHYDNNNNEHVDTISICDITWPVVRLDKWPNIRGIQLTWPFSTANDATLCYGNGDYRAKDINEARIMAKVVFNIEPSREVLERAVALHNYLIEKYKSKIPANR